MVVLKSRQQGTDLCPVVNRNNNMSQKALSISAEKEVHGKIDRSSGCWREITGADPHWNWYWGTQGAQAIGGAGARASDRQGQLIPVLSPSSYELTSTKGNTETREEEVEADRQCHSLGFS